VTVIPLGLTLLPGSCDLPGGCNAPSRCVSPASRGLPPYLVLLRVGFTMPCTLLRRRCALTAPFHPYPGRPGRYVFCGTGRLPALTLESRTLSGTLLCGVRTFLPGKPGRPSGPLASLTIIIGTGGDSRWVQETNNPATQDIHYLPGSYWPSVCIVFGR